MTKTEIIQKFQDEEDKKLMDVYKLVQDSIMSYELNFSDTIYILQRLLYETNKMIDEVENGDEDD